jgi:hypothetical protein
MPPWRLAVGKVKRRTSNSRSQAVFGPALDHRRLDKLVAEARTIEVTDDQIREQRASVAYDDAPENAKVTRESVQEASNSFRIKKV